MTSILMVDDEQDFLDSIKRMLRIEGYDELTAMADPTRVEALMADTKFDVAFLDITMPGMDGLELLRRIKERSPETECVMLTAHDSIELVIKAIKMGAYDYLLKPVSPEQLTHVLDRALERKRLLASLLLRSEQAFEKMLDHPEAFGDIVTNNKAMLRLLHEAELHAVSDIPVLITGETGAGKEVLAQAIHKASRRAAGPMVAVNMLALSPTLFESEFFGHAKGSFTGADREKAGYLSKARGGTLFLDEIGDLSLEIQGKLLRILQEGEFVPVGKTQPEKADVRIIAATNQDLAKLVAQRKFRKDLFYRLQFAHLDLPPLRSRREDIPLLATQFLRQSTHPEATISEEGLDVLAAHDWPGNVRELKGTLEAAANLASGKVIKPEHLRLPEAKARSRQVQTDADDRKLRPLADVEREHIVAVYRAVGNNKSQAARVLGIGLQTLIRRLKSYRIP